MRGAPTSFPNGLLVVDCIGFFVGSVLLEIAYLGAVVRFFFAASRYVSSRRGGVRWRSSFGCSLLSVGWSFSGAVWCCGLLFSVPGSAVAVPAGVPFCVFFWTASGETWFSCSLEVFGAGTVVVLVFELTRSCCSRGSASELAVQCVVQRVVSDFPRDFSCCRMVCSFFSILAKLSSTEADRDDKDFSRSRTLMQRRCSRSFASSFSFSITCVWCVTALSSSIIFKERCSSLSLASFLSLSTQRESVSTLSTRGCSSSLTQVRSASTSITLASSPGDDVVRYAAHYAGATIGKTPLRLFLSSLVVEP